jgi:hypothetical protein
VIDNAGAIIAGGETEGIVADSGGETLFTLAAGGGGVAASEGAVTVTIVAAGDYADEYTWNIDGGTAFPDAGSPYDVAGSPYTVSSHAIYICIPSGA